MRHVNVVAEIGCNHMGRLDLAKEMIAEAKRCGCDYVKLQKRDVLGMPDTVRAKPYISHNSFGSTYGEHRVALEFGVSEWQELKEYADMCGIGFFATAFDVESVHFLHDLEMPFLKIGSGQVRDLAFLDRVHQMWQGPIVVSTGMCSDKDVQAIVMRLAGSRRLILCQATSAYPCEETDVNLSVIPNWLPLPGSSSNLRIGLSGHYVSGNGAIEAAAVALGVVYIERHFTLDRTWKGTDQAASLEPAGMANVVKAVRTVERALGSMHKEVLDCERSTLEKQK